MKEVEMTQCWPYKEDNEWFFRVIYEVTDKDTGEVMLITIPKIRNPFHITSKPSIELNESDFIGDMSCTLHGLYGDLPVDYGSLSNIDSTYKNYFYAETIVKEGKKPAKEMTIAQIEKELGYPVKVVKEKGKK